MWKTSLQDCSGSLPSLVQFTTVVCALHKSLLGSVHTDWVLLGRSNTVQYSLHHPEFQTLRSDPVVFVSSDQLVSVFLVGSDTFLL